MPSKKKSTKKDGDLDISIKVNNLEKAIKQGMKKKEKNWCGGCGGGGHFWIFGSALAIVMSYTQNSSILWAILHGILSWLYVAYRAMVAAGWF